MEEGKFKLIQRLGENTAYTFKGLYKESDWLEWQYRIYLLFPIVFSIVSLGFGQEIPDIGIRILTAISLIFISLGSVDI